MTPRDLLTLLALAAMWGASFLFIKLGVDEVPPLGVVETRLVLGALTVVGFALALRGLGLARPMLAAMRRPGVYVVGVVNAGLPYLCFAWGETRVSSGLAAIANATTPLWSALLGAAVMALRPRTPGAEGLTLSRAAGILVGFTGVVLLVGIDGLGGGVDLAGLSVVLAAASLYAVGSLLARSVFTDDHPLVPAATSIGACAIILLPLAAAAGRPAQPPSAVAALAVAALGVVGTGFAYVLFYRLLARVGPTRTLTVTYLLPAFALVYGAVFLGEAIRPTAVAALALILAGVAVTSGVGTRRRRHAEQATHAESPAPLASRAS